MTRLEPIHRRRWAPSAPPWIVPIDAVSRLAFAALLMGMVLFGGLSTSSPTLQAALTALVTIAVAAAALEVHVTGRVPSIPRVILALPIVVVATALLAANTDVAFEATTRLLGWFLVFGVAIVVFAQQNKLGAIALATSALLAFLLASYLVTTVWLWGTWLHAGGSLIPLPLRPAEASVVLSSPNAMATVLTLLLAITWMLTGAGTRRVRVAFAIAGAVVALEVLVTGSRGAWLGVLAGSTAAGLALAPKLNLAREMWSRYRVRAGVGVGLLGAVILASASPVLARFGSGGGQELRVELATVSLRMFVSDPVTGVGPGNWPVERATFTRAGEPDFYVTHAHNLYLQIAAEFGIVGIVVALAVVLLAFQMIRSRLNDDRPIARRIGITAVFAFFLVAFQMLVDNQSGQPAVVVLLMVIGAALVAAGPAGSDLLPGRTKAALLFVAASLVVAGVFTQVRIQQASAIVQLADRGDWPNALVLARAEDRAEPRVGVLALIRGLAAARQGQMVEAQEAFERGAIGDDFPTMWLNLAAVRQARGDRSGASTALAAALRLGSQQSTIAVPAGVVWLRLGDPGQAQSAFAAAFRATPSLVGDAFWRSDEMQLNWRRAVEEAVLSASPDVALQVALFAEDRELADQAAARDPAGSNPDIVRAWFGDLESIRRFEQLAEGQPADAELQGWCVRLLTRASQSGADRCRVRLGILDPAQLEYLGSQAYVSSEAPEENQPSGAYADLYGIALYGRPTPVAYLVPGLPYVALR